MDNFLSLFRIFDLVELYRYFLQTKKIQLEQFDNTKIH